MSSEQGLNHTSLQNQTLLKLIVTNFPEMKRINGFFLDYYQILSDASHSSLNIISFLCLSLFFIASFILGLVFNIYFNFRFEQNIESFKYFSFIPNHYLLKLK